RSHAPCTPQWIALRQHKKQHGEGQDQSAARTSLGVGSVHGKPQWLEAQSLTDRLTTVPFRLVPNQPCAKRRGVERKCQPLSADFGGPWQEPVCPPRLC